MSDIQEESSLLDRLDTEQNDVIRALDELNIRVENVIREWTRPNSEAA